jgi:hypothetical protein
MSPVALYFGLIFAAAAAAAYPAGWACDLYRSCTTSQMLGWAAGIMFLTYLVSSRLEAHFRKTNPLGTPAERRLIARSAISSKSRAGENRPSRAPMTRGPLLLPSPRSARDA